MFLGILRNLGFRQEGSSWYKDYYGGIRVTMGSIDDPYCMELSLEVPGDVEIPSIATVGDVVRLITQVGDDSVMRGLKEALLDILRIQQAIGLLN